jgi:hypothetical protein
MPTLSMSKIRTSFVVAVLTIVSVSQALHAQSSAELGTVTVPFAFQAGTAHFAPGTYTFSNPPMDNLVSIRGSSQSALTVTIRDGGSEHPTVSELVFRRYGNRYFLREVRIKGTSDHLLYPESKAERLAERDQQASDRTSISAHGNIEIALLEGPR